jgi:hypothetical protein
MKYIFFCLVCVCASGLFASSVDAATCHRFNNSKQISDNVPGFGLPFNVFNASTNSDGTLTGTEMTMDADCQGENQSAKATVKFGGKDGGRLIYEKGYRLNTLSQQWEEFNMTPSQAASDRGETRYQNSAYFVYETQTTISRPFFEVGGEVGKVYVIAYMCEEENNEWKCGCTNKACSGHNWQIQGISAP